MSRHNGRPLLAASELPPSLLMLTPGTRAVVACPDCGTWRVPARGMLPAHRAADQVTRCGSSGQRIRIDLTPTEWQARLATAVREAGQRHATRVHRSGRPSAALPIFRFTRAA